MLLIAGGTSMANYANKGNIAGATLKGALNAVKGGEIRAFILKAASEIAA